MNILVAKHLMAASVVMFLLAAGYRVIVSAIGDDRSARYQFGRWVLMWAALLLPIQCLIAALVPHQPWRFEVNALLLGETEPTTREYDGAPRPSEPQSPSKVLGAIQPEEHERKWSTNTLHFLMVAYFVGVGVMLLRMAIRMIMTIRMLQQCKTLEHPGTLRLFHSLRGDLAVELLESSTIASPACVAFPSSPIVFPTELRNQLSTDALRCVMRHELIHVARQDWLASWNAATLALVFWYHPAAWWLCRSVAQDRELSCDGLVVAETGLPRTYARTLLDLHVEDRDSRKPSLVWSNGIRQIAPLKRRLEMLGTPESRLTPSRRLLLVVGSLAMIVILSLTQAQIVLAVDLPAESGVEDNQSASGQKASIILKARAEGRSPADMYNHLSPLFAPDGIRAGHQVTNQETILTFQKGEVKQNVVQAKDIFINLPEGSQLRAVLSGDDVVVDPSGDATKVRVTEGALTVYGPNEVVRLRTANDNPALVIEATLEEEVSIRLRSKGGNNHMVTILTDLESGIPQDEGQPPHNAVRYKMFDADPEGEKPVRLKMQWIYDMQKLKKEAIKQNEKMLKQFSQHMSTIR